LRRIRSNIKAQDARLDQAILLYEDTLRRSLEEVENSLTSYEREREQRTQLEKAVASNRRSVELSRELYVAGLSDFLSVLEAQNALYDGENQLAKAKRQWRSIWWLSIKRWEAVGKAQGCERTCVVHSIPLGKFWQGCRSRRAWFDLLVKASNDLH